MAPGKALFHDLLEHVHGSGQAKRDGQKRTRMFVRALLRRGKHGDDFLQECVPVAASPLLRTCHKRN